MTRENKQSNGVQHFFLPGILAALVSSYLSWDLETELWRAGLRVFNLRYLSGEGRPKRFVIFVMDCSAGWLCLFGVLNWSLISGFHYSLHCVPEVLIWFSWTNWQKTKAKVFIPCPIKVSRGGVVRILSFVTFPSWASAGSWYKQNNFPRINTF